jgi:hypothetical protein
MISSRVHVYFFLPPSQFIYFQIRKLNKNIVSLKIWNLFYFRDVHTYL